MANERYVELALAALRDTIAAGISTRLAAIETEQGLAALAISRPVEVVKARIPNDNRSPMIAVYWGSFASTSQRQGMISVDLTIAVSMVGPDLDTLEDAHAHYATALIELIRGDSTLGGRVVSTQLTDGDAAINLGDRSATRMVTAFGVEVRIYNP